MLLDGVEGVIEASSVGSKVTIIYPRVRSSEGVHVGPFNHSDVAEVRRLLRQDVTQFICEVHHDGLYVGGCGAGIKFWQMDDELGGLIKCYK